MNPLDPDPLPAELHERATALAARVAGSLEDLPEDDAARRALAALAQEGLTAWCVPAAHGGADAAPLVPSREVSARALCALREALAYHSGMLDVMLVMQGLGSYPLARGGAPELARGHLPRVARGDAIAAFAVTEEGAGSDLGGVAMLATRDDGDGWRLTGRKTFISNAGLADLYTLLARTSGEPGDGGAEGLTMFLVPADTPGLSVDRFEVMAPHPIGEVVLADALVPDSQRLGDVGRGLALALETLGRFRVSVAAAACGFARRALDESKARLAAREQFGRPLATRQALRFDLAEMDVRLRAAQLLTGEAARLVDQGRPATAEVSRAKLFASEAAGWICDRAVQHHGGLGVRRGTTPERLYREVRALRIYEGTSEVQRLLLARALLGESPHRT